MKEEDIKETILNLLKKIAPDSKPEMLRPEDDIRRTLDIDSFDFLQFIVAIDKALGINIPEEDYGKVSTLKSLIEYINLEKVDIQDEEKP